MAHTQGKCGRLGVGEICRESPRFHSLRESTGQWWAMTIFFAILLILLLPFKKKAAGLGAAAAGLGAAAAGLGAAAAGLGLLYIIIKIC
jgi:hypothetical protein